MRIRLGLILGLLAAGTLLGAAGPEPEPPEFRHVLTGQELDLSPRPGEVLTEAVQSFHRNGVNPYRDDHQAIADGRRLYQRNCGFCHLLDASGGNAPPLDGRSWTYATSETDAGLFSVIYGGAYGAMRSWARHGMAQDDMLRIMAYLRRIAQPGPERDAALAAAAIAAGSAGVH